MLCGISYFDGRLFLWEERSGTFLIKKCVADETCYTFEDEGFFSLPNKQNENVRCVAQIAGKTLRAMYIVVESINERTGPVISLYNVLREDGKWSARDIGCFQTEEPIIERIHLTQDLMLVWDCHHSLDLFSFASGLKRIRRIPFTEHVKEILLLREVYVDSSVFNGCSKNNILLIVAKTLSSDKESSVLFSVLIVNSLTDSDSQVLHLPSDYFIVKFYSSIITAVNIASLNISNICSNFSASDLIKDAEKPHWSKNSTTICTEQRQFVVFVGGCIHFICIVPFPDIHQIISFKMHSPERTLYILQSVKGACAVEKLKFPNQLQIYKSWEDSIAVIAGDFINAGTPQLLFISQLDPDLILDTCVLTNIAINFYPRTAPSIQSTSHNKDAIKGMKKTLLAGQIAFSEARRKEKEMQKVIEQTAQILEIAVSEGQPNGKVYDSNLICIVPATKGPLSLATTEKEKLKATINVLATWKTVLQDNWILGWSLRNESDLLLSDFHIHLGTPKETMEYKYKTYRHLVSDPNCQPNLYFDEDNNKGLKEGELLSIVVSLSLPSFAHSEFEVTCTLRWKSLSVSDNNDLFRQHFSAKCQLCVNTALEKQHSSFKELSVVQQLMSLRVLQDRLSLCLKSEHTDLTYLEKMLTLKLEHYPHIISHLSSKINIFMDPVSPLYGLNFTINCSSVRQSETVVHYRETKQLFLFVHWLHNSAPEDVTISVETLSLRDMKQLLISSMKEELQFIISSVQQTQNKAINLSKVDGSDPTSLQHRLKCKHEHILKNSVALSIGEYIQFRLWLLETECKSDDIIGQVAFY